MKRIRVGDIVLDIELLGKGYLQETIPAYEVPIEGDAHHTIESFMVDEIIVPNEDPRYQEPHKKLYSSENGEVIITFDPKNNHPIQRIEYDYQYRHVQLSFTDRYSQDLAEIEYLWTGILFFEIALLHGYSALHASAIEYGHEAILFSAPSGTGKSTQARLWKTVYPQVETINDDKPLLKVEHGQVYVYGSPWSGKDLVNQNAKVPLKAIVFLRQEGNNTIYPLTTQQKIIELYRNTYRPRISKLAEINLSMMNQILPIVVIISYGCNMTLDAVFTLHNYLYGGTR